jgi:hypothetical protein
LYFAANSPKPNDPDFSPVEPEDYQANMTPNGSIFNQGL